MTTNILAGRLPSREEVARRAYGIYVARGCQPGRETDDWLQAEYELMHVPIRQIAALPLPRPDKRKKTTRATVMQSSALIMFVQGALLFGSSSIR
jgi:hypothetical protein